MSSGALNWDGELLSCFLTCSRMYCWLNQRGGDPEHSQPHERMMVDYLHEMSYMDPPESQDKTLILKIAGKHRREKSIFCLNLKNKIYFSCY